MRYKIIIYIFLFAFTGYYLHVGALEKPDVDKQIFRDSIGNLYISIDVPVFLHISDNPEGENSIILQPEKPTDVPIVFKNPGNHRFTHLDLILNQNIPFFLKVDDKAPVTKWHTECSFYKENDTMYSGSDFIVYLESGDNRSGLNEIYYSINKSDYKVYKDYILFDKEGFNELKYFGLNNVGNIEKYKKLNIITDHKAPETKLEIIGDQHQNVLSARSQIKLKAFDNISGVENIYYSINDESYNIYTKALSVNRLKEGYHNLRYYAKDIVGNIEEEHIFDFFVDKTPPIIIEEITGNRFVADGKEFTSGRSQLRITSVDNKAGVKAVYYSIDDKEYQLYERPVFLSGHSGEINIRTYAVDNVNNRGEGRLYHSEQTYIPYVDLNAPIIDYRISGPNIFLRDTLFLNDKSKIHLNATDRESGVNRIIYRINQSDNIAYESPFSVIEQGFYQINYTAFDNVDNSNSSMFAFYSCLQGPSVQYNFSVNHHDVISINGDNYKVYHKHVKVYLSATDDKTGTKEIFYSINGQAEKEYIKPIDGFTEGVINKITIRAIDMLGNETIENISFFVQN